MGVGRTLTVGVTVPILAAGAAALAAGIDFEAAFAGIGKTVDGVMTSTGELTDLGRVIRQEFRDLALEIPIATNELAHLGKVVGQLGIRAEDVADVTETIAMLGATTELSAEDAARGLIRFGNILGVTSENMGEFLLSAGSAVVALGNASVSTEGEILNLGLRLAAAGDRANFSGQEILAWATTLSDLGVRAEAGGSAVSRAINEMLLAVNTGSDNLATFASVTNQTVDEFVAAFEDDASQALSTFIDSLQEGIDQGTIGIDTLNELGLSGIRSMDILGRLGNAEEIFAKNLEIANISWAEQLALQEEFNKRAATVEAQIQILKNSFTDLGITIFDLVKDDITAVIRGIRDLIDGFKNLDPRVQKAILQFALIAAAVGPVLIVLGGIVAGIGLFISGITALLSPIGLATVAIVGLTGALAAIAIPNLVGLLGDLDSIQQKALDVGRALGFVTDVPSTGGAKPVNATQADRAVEQEGTTPSFQLPSMDTFLQGLKDLGGEEVTSAIESITRIGDSFGRIFDRLANSPVVTQALSDIGRSLKNIAKIAIDFSITNLEKFADWLEDSEDELVTAGENFAIFSAAVVGAIEDLSALSADSLTGLFEIMGAFGTLAEDLQSGNLKDLPQDFLNIRDAFSSLMIGLVSDLAASNLMQSWAGNFDLMQMIASQALTNIAVEAGIFAMVFPIRMATGWSAAVGTALGFAVDMFAAGVAFIQNAINGVLSLSGNFIGTVSNVSVAAVGAFSSLVGAYAAGGVAFIEAARASINDRGKALLAAAGDVASAAAGAFAGFAGAFAAAGVAFIQGAIAGIESMIGALVAAAAAAGAAAAGGLASTLQVESPSKVTMEIMTNFMQGAIVGIEDNIKALTESTQHAAILASKSFSDSFMDNVSVLDGVIASLTNANMPSSSVVNNNQQTNVSIGDISGVQPDQMSNLPGLLAQRAAMLGVG